MEEKAKGTLKGHLCKMLSALYLWTTQIHINRFFNSLKNDLCFSCDEMLIKPISETEDTQEYELIFDFGDIQTSFSLLFKKSEFTKRWVLSEIK